MSGMVMRIIIGSIFSRVVPSRARVVALAAGASLLLTAAMAPAEPGTYQTPEAFVAQSFADEAPQARALWLRADLRDAVADILGRSPLPRIRFWQRGGQTVWILDEVGKDEPITAGVVVRDGAIDDIRVLVFRESRGWEVKYPFFTRQFEDARLTGRGGLDQSIDGITGATLSVRAMTRMARVALLLDAHARGNRPDLARADASRASR